MAKVAATNFEGKTGCQYNLNLPALKIPTTPTYYLRDSHPSPLPNFRPYRLSVCPNFRLPDSLTSGLPDFPLFLINISLSNRLVGVYPPIAHKGPVGAVPVGFHCVNFHHRGFFLLVGCFVNQVTKGVAHE